MITSDEVRNSDHIETRILGTLDQERNTQHFTAYTWTT